MLLAESVQILQCRHMSIYKIGYDWWHLVDSRMLLVHLLIRFALLAPILKTCLAIIMFGRQVC